MTATPIKGTLRYPNVFSSYGPAPGGIGGPETGPAFLASRRGPPPPGRCWGRCPPSQKPGCNNNSRDL